MSEPRKVTLAEAAEIIKTSEVPVVLAVGAPWCIDCRRAQPFYMAMGKEYDDKAVFLHADCDEEPELRTVYKVQHIPTMMVFKKGEEQGRIVEVRTPSALREFFNQYI